MLKHFIPSGSFSKNVLTLFTGSAVAQAIPILATPVLTRIFTPDDFGVLAVYIALVSFFAIISSGRYELAIMLPREKKDAGVIVKLSLVIAITVSVISLFIILFSGEYIAVWFKNERILKWIWLIPVSVFLTSIYQIMNYWNTRQKEFKTMAQARVTQSIGNVGTNVGLGYSIQGPFGLIAGQVIGQFLAAFLLVIKTPLNEWKLIMRSKPDELKKQAILYKDFPLLNSSQVFVDMLQNTGVIWTISNFFSAGVLGFYSFTFRILKAPLGLIGSSTAQVFYQVASEKYANGEDIVELVSKTLKHFILLAVPVFSIIMIFGPEIFAFVFGENWREAGEYAQILSPWLFMNFLISSVSHVPLIVNRQKQGFYIGLVGNVLILLSVISGGLLHDIKTGFILLSTTQVIFLSGVIWWYLRISKQGHN